MNDAHHPGTDRSDVCALIGQHAEALSAKLQRLRKKDSPGPSAKPLRAFSTAETAKFLGIKEGYLRTLALEGKGSHPIGGISGRRSYSAEQILELRHVLDQSARSSHRYVPHRRGNEHLQLIAVVNFKGGSCKTTTCANLSQYLALRGHRILAVDLDPQASLTALCGYQPELDIGAYETLLGAIDYEEPKPLAGLIRKTNIPGLDLVPANIELSEFEFITAKVLGSKQASAASYFTRLDEALAPVRDSYDVVIFDCPPQLGFLTIAALCAATSVLVTIHPQMLDLMSMSQFLHMMRSNLAQVENAGANLRYDWVRYLITRFEPSDGPQVQMNQFIRALFGDHVLRHEMLKSVAISDAGMTKQTVYEVDRRLFTPSTYDRAVECLDAVNGEIEELVLATWGRGDVVPKAREEKKTASRAGNRKRIAGAA
jgi:chromosome partitioning protein